MRGIRMSDIKLEDDVGYPFRASLTKKARCGMCIFFSGMENLTCKVGHKLIFPLINGEHHCKDYRYKPWGTILKHSPRSAECKDCSHLYMGVCDGIKHHPFQKEPTCEFFRHKDLTCKNAIPMFQYGSYIRNNYCKLPPHLRDGDSSRSWKWMCPNAHTPDIEHRKCYKPKNKTKDFS